MAKMTRKLPKHSGTFHSVQKWHKHMISELGWMVILKAKGYGYKVTAYKKSIDNLLKTIDHISTEYEDKNKKHDLNVLRMNIEVLKEAANTLL
jgi:hypothetical protein